MGKAKGSWQQMRGNPLLALFRCAQRDTIEPSRMPWRPHPVFLSDPIHDDSPDLRE